MSFRVIKPGRLATIQDTGRMGLAEYGISQSGIADEQAFHWANHLLANSPDAAAIELTYGDMELEALDEIELVITGADMQFSCNGQLLPMWQTLTIKAGDKIKCNHVGQHQGMKAYIATANGFQSPSYLGARSVNVREQLGQTIQVGDTLATLPQKSRRLGRMIPFFFKPDYSKPVTLRLIAGYQFQDFNQQQIETVLGQTYHIDPASDRTGYRLQGKVIESVPAKMISEGVAYGSVEITTEGQPIVLMKDRPTMGGYPKLGTVFSLDLAKLTQCQPGVAIRFELMSVQQAQLQRRQFDTFFGIEMKRLQLTV